MMRRNAGLLVALAAMGGFAGPPSAVVVGSGGSVQAPSLTKGAAGTQLPQGGSGSILGALLGKGGGYGYRRPPQFKNHLGWSMAEAKRRKRKTRNRLRAKGQHRQAVR